MDNNQTRYFVNFFYNGDKDIKAELNSFLSQYGITADWSETVVSESVAA